MFEGLLTPSNPVLTGGVVRLWDLVSPLFRKEAAMPLLINLGLNRKAIKSFQSFGV
jgi:hypothetical protein